MSNVSTRFLAGLLGLALVAGACSGGSDPASAPRSAAGGIDAAGGAEVGSWKTWVLASAEQIKVPEPPKPGSAQARAELAELHDLAGARTPEVEKEAHHWSDYPALEPWVKENMQLVSEQSKNPPLASRGYGLVSAAMSDAMVATYHWKYVYNRQAPKDANPVVPVDPVPSYPSEHAAIAGAASRVLAYLFPERPAAQYDAQAEAAAESRVAGGMNYRSDVEAGLALGRAVADAVIAKGKTDGYDRHFEGQIPTGRGLWAPPPGAPPANSQPVEPLAGTWKTWATDVRAVRPGPPPEFGSPQFVTEAQEVLDTGNRLTDEQKKIAQFWAGGAGTPLPPGIWNQILLDTIREEHTLSTPHVARAFALLNASQSDAGVAAWDAKYAYWSPRPVNAIRDLGLDPDFRSFLPTPMFPSYISGHSTYSSAAAEVLSYLFPDRATQFQAQAREAAVSRLYGGIHYRADNEVGLQVGAKVGQAIVARARQDGATMPAAQVTASTRPSVTPTTGAGTNFDPPPPSTPGTRKSQPYWVQLATLEGAGNATTRTFSVDAGALQWKVSWQCQTAPFSVVSVNAAGQESRRKVADALSCPSSGEGFSVEKGVQSLRVTSNGPWKAVIEQQVEVPLIEPAPAELASARVLGTVQFHNVDKEGEGTARIYELADGRRIIRLENFFVSINSDLEIRLSDSPDVRSTDEAVRSQWKQVAFLKATVGSMNYEIPRDLDVSQFRSVVIWCEITRNAYSAGPIQRGG